MGHSKSKEQKKEPVFKKLSEVLKESSTTAEFRAWLKKQPWQHEGHHLSEYLDFVLKVNKRYSSFTSGQKCGDDMEKGKDLLQELGHEIVSLFGHLVFQGKKLIDTVLELESVSCFAPMLEYAQNVIQEQLQL